MTDIILTVVLLVIVGAAVCYIVRAKKKGAKCIGCPMGGNCSAAGGSNSECSCGCQGHSEV